MAFIDVNLDVVESNSEVHPEGMTLVEITEAEVKTAKEGGGKYINWKCKVVNSENKRPLWIITSLKPDALWNLKRLVEACGYKWDPAGFNTEDLYGRQVYVEVTQEEYNGSPSNKVKPNYKPAA